MKQDVEARIERIRRFNRFYTKELGLLQHKLMDSRYSLAEARVLWEIGRRKKATAVEVGQELRLDAGYLSRIVGKLANLGLIHRRRSESDGRAWALSLTTKGTREFIALDRSSQEQIRLKLRGLDPEEQNRIVQAMQTIEQGFSGPDIPGNGLSPTPILLRTHQPGDMGWVLERHAALYGREYGWGGTFEALVSAVITEFLRDCDGVKTRCWIAERDGERVGSVFLMRKTDDTGTLRLLLLEPSARGLGLGARLVEECLRGAREAGYKRITLWTSSVLEAAVHIYQGAGFELVGEERHSRFGKDLIGQTWERDL
jgi:DNA-binding MarR family transcriptional regulator/GNAT superfamily N-acetyltransferase